MATGSLAPDLLKRYTPDDLLRLNDSVEYELVDGRLLQRHAGMLSSQVAATIAGALAHFCNQTRMGHVFGPDAGYHCFPGAPDTVRKADVSIILRGRLPGEVIPKGHAPLPPDLAVEVTSPNDLVQVLEEKLMEYLRVGVPLVWVVSPRVRTVTVYRSARLGRVSLLTEADMITGEEVLPGFECPVRDFFD